MFKSYPYIDHYSDTLFVPFYIHLSHGGYCTAIIFNGIDSVFIAACFHFATQMQLITMKIRNAFNHSKYVGMLTAIENQRIRQDLIVVIEEQNNLYDLIDLFIEVFTPIILMHFISTAIVIGIGSIDVIMVRHSYINPK